MIFLETIKKWGAVNIAECTFNAYQVFKYNENKIINKCSIEEYLALEKELVEFQSQEKIFYLYMEIETYNIVKYIKTNLNQFIQIDKVIYDH